MTPVGRPRIREDKKQRPKTKDHQHFIIRDVPKSLIKKGIYKARNGRPSVSLRWVLIALLERWVQGVNLTSDTPITASNEKTIPKEQSF